MKVARTLQTLSEDTHLAHVYPRCDEIGVARVVEEARELQDTSVGRIRQQQRRAHIAGVVRVDGV